MDAVTERKTLTLIDVRMAMRNARREHAAGGYRITAIRCCFDDYRDLRLSAGSTAELYDAMRYDPNTDSWTVYGVRLDYTHDDGQRHIVLDRPRVYLGAARFSTAGPTTTAVLRNGDASTLNVSF